jgi:hypothetical protein
MRETRHFATLMACRGCMLVHRLPRLPSLFSPPGERAIRGATHAVARAARRRMRRKRPNS